MRRRVDEITQDRRRLIGRFSEVGNREICNERTDSSAQLCNLVILRDARVTTNEHLDVDRSKLRISSDSTLCQTAGNNSWRLLCLRDASDNITTDPNRILIPTMAE